MLEIVDPYATNAILAYLAILNEGVACILNSSLLIFMICTYTEFVRTQLIFNVTCIFLVM